MINITFFVSLKLGLRYICQCGANCWMQLWQTDFTISSLSDGSHICISSVKNGLMATIMWSERACWTLLNHNAGVNSRFKFILDISNDLYEVMTCLPLEIQGIQGCLGSKHFRVLRGLLENRNQQVVSLKNVGLSTTPRNKFRLSLMVAPHLSFTQGYLEKYIRVRQVIRKQRKPTFL